MKKSYFRNSIWIASLGCLLALSAACGDDDDNTGNTPEGGSKNNGGSSAGTNTTGGKNNGGSGGSTAGSKNTAGTDNQVGGGGAGPDMTGNAGAGGEVNCTDAADSDCFDKTKCAPKALEDFLNACPIKGSGCQPFDNALLTSLKAGKLPKLP